MLIFLNSYIFYRISANRETTTRAEGYRSALDGLIIRDMILLNAGAECVRLRCEYAGSTVCRYNLGTN